MANILDVAKGAAIGAGLMYMLDPERGRRRRARLRDQATHLSHKASEAAGKAARDARNRAVGVLAETRGRLTDEDNPNDQVLEARVRSAIGRVSSHPHAIEVRASDGTVHIAGPVVAGEADAVLQTTAAVRGVRDVTHQLELHDSPAGVPGLQGGGDRSRARGYWSPTMRAAGGIAGGALMLGSRRLPRPLRSVARATGAGLALRAATNLDTDELLGVNDAHHVVGVHKAIHVGAPIEDVFAFWSHVENFPMVMGHLEEVRRIDELTSHWTATGPLGRTFEWDAEITGFEENSLIAWRSLPGGDIANAGTVRFEPAADGGTRITIHLRYEPIAGAIGHGVASLLGADPKSAMDDDLVRFKSLMENGKATAHGHTVRRDEIATNEA